MNVEYEVKNILRSSGTPETIVKQICIFTIFNKEDIIAAIEKGGKRVSDIYENLLKFHKIRLQKE